MFKRTYYRVLVPAAVVALLLGWTLEWFTGAGPNRFDSVALLGAAAAFAVLGVALWRRVVSVQAVDVLFAAGVGVFMLIRLGYAVYFLEPGKSIGTELTEFAFWIHTYFGLLFLVFGIDRGLFASVAFLAAATSLPVPALAFGGITAQELYSLSMLYMSSAVTIFVFRVLGKALLRAGAERRVFQRLAVTDSLTGIANRRGLSERLEREVDRCERYGAELSLLLLDLDRFKRVNDEHGHAVGDRMLRGVAGLLQRESRNVDVVGRWGGEEFMIILPEIAAHEATQVASRIRRAVGEHDFDDGVPITISIGVTSYRSDDTPESLVERADEALYLAKERGRDRVEVAGEHESH